MLLHQKVTVILFKACHPDLAMILIQSYKEGLTLSGTPTSVSHMGEKNRYGPHLELVERSRISK